MKSLMQLWKVLADDLASRCSTSATMDWKTVQGRYEHEGFSFFTISLPRFGKGFQKSLDRGKVDRDLFAGFVCGKAGLPRLFGGFLDRVFDRSSGTLRDDPCIDAIFAVRQLTLLFSKILLECSDARKEDAVREYIMCEQDVREHDLNRSSSDLEDFARVSSLLYAGIFSKVDNQIYYNEIMPKHGPGATADKLRGNAKYRLSSWTQRLEEIFPCGEFLIPSWSEKFKDQYDAIDILEPGAEMPVRVILVPKTLKTPRVIAVEPTAMQYAQQGIAKSLVHAIQGNDTLGRMIGFDDQPVNQRMAMIGSLTGTLATLDLSEASDRVSNQLVRTMLRRHPHLHEAVDASRSRKAEVPGHGVVRLAKYASMGSALCFPVEAMIFTTCIFIGIEKALNVSLTRRHIRDLSSQVRVYGDDIIVPVDYVLEVVDALETFGFRVNVDKSFWTGRFRESCGKEYYAGDDVSVVKVRRMFPTHPQHASEVISMVSLRNQLYFAGCWQATRWLDDRIREVIHFFPTVLPTSSVLGRHSYLGYISERTGTHLQNPLVKGYVDATLIPSDPLDGSGALLKFHLKDSAMPSADRWHLERAGRPRAVSIKLGWASAV